MTDCPQCRVYESLLNLLWKYVRIAFPEVAERIAKEMKL